MTLDNKNAQNRIVGRWNAVRRLFECGMGRCEAAWKYEIVSKFNRGGFAVRWGLAGLSSIDPVAEAGTEQ